MEWISVKDRLPEDGWRILLYGNFEDEYGNERIGVYLGGKYWSICGGTSYKPCNTQPIWWMPLPEPPESEEGMKNKKFIVAEIIEALTGVYGIETHFGDWNNPRLWATKVTPAEVQTWVVKRIKEYANESEEE